MPLPNHEPRKEVLVLLGVRIEPGGGDVRPVIGDGKATRIVVDGAFADSVSIAWVDSELLEEPLRSEMAPTELLGWVGGPSNVPLFVSLVPSAGLSVPLPSLHPAKRHSAAWAVRMTCSGTYRSHL